MVRGFRRGSRKDEAALERERHESRTLSVFPDDDGMYVVKGRLPAEVGALLMRAVEAASDALYREKREPRLETDTEREKAAAQRRADALGLLAERALEVGFGGKGEEERGGEAGCCCAAEDDEAHPHPIPISGTRAERYQVMLHVEPETLRAEAEPGCSELEDGTRVSAATSRRLSCDAGWSGSVMPPTARSWMWDAGPAPFRRPSGGLWRPGTGDAGSRAAGFGSPMAITSSTGPMEERRSWTMWCFVDITIAWCTREDGGWTGGARGGRCSSIPGEGPTSRAVAVAGGHKATVGG